VIIRDDGGLPPNQRLLLAAPPTGPVITQRSPWRPRQKRGALGRPGTARNLVGPTKRRFSASIPLLVGVLACAGCPPSPQRADLGLPPDSARSVGLALADQLSAAYKRSDWPTVATMVAPDYLGTAPGLTWTLDSLQAGFPKIHFIAWRLDAATVKELSPGVLLVNEDGRLTETYDGQDISGQYRMTDVWVQRGPRWLLLFEQEVPLPASP
jgi:hypothetical protein